MTAEASPPKRPGTTVKVNHGYDASPGDVYDAWLTPDHAGRFLFATPEGRMVRTEIDPKVGGKFCIVESRQGQEIEHVGTYVELERPLRLAFDFSVPRLSSETTRVTIDIEPQGTGCEVFLTHCDVPGDSAERTQGGWEKILKGLEAVL